MNRAERRRQQREQKRQASDVAKLAPQVKALIEHGLARHRLGDLDNAKTSYGQALAIDPENGEANYLQGIALHQSGRSADGLAHLERAVAASPGDAAYQFDLGNLYEACGRLADGQKAFERAITIDPTHTDARYNLGNNLLAQGQFAEAVIVYEEVVRQRPDHAKAHSNLGNALQTMGRVDDAQAAYIRTLELDPGNVAVRHMLAALRGDTVAKPPAEFVSRLFDRYAPRFEAHVTQALGYSVPNELCEALAELEGRTFHVGRVADLGAGTGLCGVALRGHADEIIAFDLSANMLAIARSKSVYDSLVTGDIIEALNKRSDSFDLFIAADVFIYVGELEALFSAVVHRRTGNALFAFSIERCEDADYVLQKTGRYAHSIAYIERLARDHDFTIALNRQVNIRKEKDGWIVGDIFVLSSTTPL